MALSHVSTGPSKAFARWRRTEPGEFDVAVTRRGSAEIARHLRRGRLTAFVDRHRIAWDSVMGALTVAYVALSFREDMATSLEAAFTYVLAALFLVEFAARCYDTRERGKYVQAHWLDLITAIPLPGVAGFRLLRLLRLLRLAKVCVLIRDKLLRRGWTETSLIWPTLALFWVTSALALWLVERDATGSSIQSIPDALRAAFITASTLGFGSHDLPVTVEGQVIAALIVFVSLGLWGFASQRLTTLWLQGTKSREHQELALVHDELRTLQKHLQVLTSHPSFHHAHELVEKTSSASS